MSMHTADKKHIMFRFGLRHDSGLKYGLVTQCPVRTAGTESTWYVGRGWVLGGDSLCQTLRKGIITLGIVVVVVGFFFGGGGIHVFETFELLLYETTQIQGK